MEQIETGQVYATKNRGPNWQIIAVDGNMVHAIRVRKADGQSWRYDQNTNGRDFPAAIVQEHWTLLG